VGEHAAELAATENTDRFTGMNNHEERSWELAGSKIERVGSNQGSFAAKDRKDRKEQTLYFYAFSAIFRG
jgi:hypothetical protein